MSAQVASKSRPGLDPAQVDVWLVAARDHAPRAAQRLVRHHLHARADGADEAAHRAEHLAHLVLGGGPDGRAERVLQLDLVQAVVAAGEHQHRAAAVEHDREGLDRRARRDAEEAGQGIDRGGAGRLHGLGPVERRGQAVDRLRRGAGDLQVGRVAGVGEGDLVLARGAGRHVLVGAEAAHHAHVRLHSVPLEAGAVEDPVVGPDVALVVRVQALLVAVERVGVLHDELARAQQAGARARLVALLGLEVVEAERQVAVGAHLVRDVVGHRLLVRHRQHEVGAAAVLELEQLLDVVAAARLPEVSGLQNRHQELHRADRVELLAHDLLGLAVGPPARRQERPHARTELTREAGPHQELVRDGLGVCRRILERGQEVGAEPGHRRRVYWRGVGCRVSGVRDDIPTPETRHPRPVVSDRSYYQPG